ncbi:MAG: SGNH/GDSL hydrolase family protein, partial [Methylococcales bacterium]|nr:SGNH/GDSL hydrolase family protein [Methylococcales bacterium]
MNILRILPFLLVSLVAANSYAQKKKETSPLTNLDLKDGDTFVFLGDSITHQCLYTQYVEDFFYTRFPERRIHFHNAGVSGDQAADALTRFDEDTAKFKAKYVSILLGMNDGHYENFSNGTFGAYTDGMKKIVSRIQKGGAIPIALSPTMFDHHQLALQLKNNPEFRFGNRPFSAQYNSLMAFYGAWLRETAGNEKMPFINFWGPLNDFTFTERRNNPDFSLVDDTIHPGAAGHMIMAYSMLWQLPPTRRAVSNITITKRGKNWKGTKGVSEILMSDKADKVTFTFLASSLPWDVPAKSSEYELKWGASSPASLGYKMTKAGHRLSNERLRIAGLAPGAYELK